MFLLAAEYGEVDADADADVVFSTHAHGVLNLSL